MCYSSLNTSPGTVVLTGSVKTNTFFYEAFSNAASWLTTNFLQIHRLSTSVRNDITSISPNLVTIRLLATHLFNKGNQYF